MIAIERGRVLLRVETLGILGIKVIRSYKIESSLSKLEALREWGIGP
jgi:hypothetical protein